MNSYGRSVIYTDCDEITQLNVVEVLQKAIPAYERNKAEIETLYDYYRGKQAIRGRTKEVRPEINNKITENRANEIVSFKVGYLMGEPVQYINQGKDDVSEELNILNEYMFAEEKFAKDKNLAEWFTICGTAYRMVLPDPTDDVDESPFEIYTLDPRYCFMVYHSGLGNKRMMSCTVSAVDETRKRYSIYTDRDYYEIIDDKIVKNEPHALGCVPVIEYPANSARLGAFEIVMSLLDAINNVASNRMDGVEQFIQALLVLKGMDISKDDVSELKEVGGIKIPADGDIRYLVQELNQTQTQTLVDNLYQSVLTICGMPNRNGGSSTSDTGTAVIMRDGWQAAEAAAKDTELMFKQAEKEFLKLTLRITNCMRNLNLRLSSIDIHFTRRNYENIQAKAQVLLQMLSSEKIHPRLAFEYCGMFIDPEAAYAASMEYAKKNNETASATGSEEQSTGTMG